ncbi:hypothetical protein [Nocardia gipuzkoensis]
MSLVVGCLDDRLERVAFALCVLGVVLNQGAGVGGVEYRQQAQAQHMLVADRAWLERRGEPGA